MNGLVPLPLIDDFLLSYNLGQAVFLLFIVSILGALPLKSRKILSINAVAFGLLFMVVVAMDAPLHYAFLGIVLLVVAPVLYTTASR